MTTRNEVDQKLINLGYESLARASTLWWQPGVDVVYTHPIAKTFKYFRLGYSGMWYFNGKRLGTARQVLAHIDNTHIYWPPKPE